VFGVEVGRAFLRPDGPVKSALMPDRIHPIAAGAEARAQALLAALADLLGDRPILDAQPNRDSR